MKHSKVFLAITACFLAFVAVAASKVHRIVGFPTGYYTSANGICTAKGTFCTNNGNIHVCRTSQHTGAYTVYLIRRLTTTCSGAKILYTLEN